MSKIKSLQCGDCFEYVEVYDDNLGSLHKCNGKMRRIRIQLKDQPFYKKLSLELPNQPERKV